MTLPAREIDGDPATRLAKKINKILQSRTGSPQINSYPLFNYPTSTKSFIECRTVYNKVLQYNELL